MLSELKLTNFRLFDDEVTVRFKPITVLIGRNSSGKSTVVKFILMLQQSFLKVDSEFPVVAGEATNLGTFIGLKNAMTQRQNLECELSVSSPFVRTQVHKSDLLKRHGLSDETGLRLTFGARVGYREEDRNGTFTYGLTHADSDAQYAHFDVDISDDYNFSGTAMLRKMDEIQEMMSPVGDPRELSREKRQILLNLLTDFVGRAELGSVLRDEVTAASYLPPTRAEPQRVITTSNIPFNDIGPEGRYAVAQLQRVAEEDEEAYAFLSPHLYYVSGVSSLEFDDAGVGTTRAFAKHAATGATVPIADLGFGVGQVLPVLVKGALMPKFSTLMVEQPEAQLHPTAQLELGSYFADLWTKRKVGSVIETHSGNILLRLRRLIARGDVSRNDVSVAYFTIDRTTEKPTIQNLDINEDGSMQTGLPMEFFGADVIEGLQLGART